MNTYEEKAMCRLKAFIVKKSLKGGRQEKKVEEKRKREEKEQITEEEKWEKEHAAQHLKAQRAKMLLKLINSKKTSKRRKLMHKVSAHRLINKVPSTCPEEMRNRIPARAMEQKEAEEVQMQHCEKKVVKKKSLFRRFLKLFRRDKTSESNETTNMITPETKEVAQQKKIEEKEMKEKKLQIEEEKKMEKETTNTFTEEEKRKVEEEVEGKKINERKVKAMRDRMQRVKLYKKMTDTEDPEEKRKLMQQVIAHRMINKIGVPCAGQRRNSILCRDMPQEEKEKEQKEVQKERQSCSKTTTLAIVNTNQESQEMPQEEPKSMKHQEVATRRTELIKMSFDKDRAEMRDIMHKVIAQKIIKKVPSTCPKEIRYRIPARASELEDKDIQYFKNIFHWSNSFSEEEKEVQNKNLIRDKTSERKKTTKMIILELKEVGQQKKTEENEIEKNKLEMEEDNKMEEPTNTFTKEEKRKVEEEVEGKKKNERKVKAMRDRIQRVKLYKKMTDTEDPEEKRKRMQQVITHRMINKIGIPCAGQRRNSILCTEVVREEKNKVQKKIKRENQV